jgi:hypothetical protein
VQHYEKVTVLAEELKKELTEIEKVAKEKQARMEALEKENQDPATDEPTKDANTESIGQLKHDIEDLNNKSKKKLGMKNEANNVEIYQDIQNAAIRHAKANNFDMVLQFQDGFTEVDYQSSANVISKMQTRACIPMWYPEANDISFKIVLKLNEAYRDNKDF